MLESVWFVLWGVLWTVYFVSDGYDLGIGSLFPFITKTEKDRLTAYRAMGPYWNGNEVWLIAAGGVTFAAFPNAYALMFSGLYSALMLILFALIFRGVALEFRDKVDHARWRTGWDVCLVVGSFLPALLLGVAFANIFQGIPIDEGGVYKGTLLGLLNPYGLLGGVLFVSMFLLHGAIWLAVKSDGELHSRAASISKTLWIVLLIVASGFLVATYFATHLYDNYIQNPVLYVIPIILIPVIAVGSLLLTRLFIGRGHWWKAFFASSGTIAGVALFGIAGLYPNLLPSSIDPAFSVTIYNGASSTLTLKIMLGVALTFIPVVLAYQAWTHVLFQDKVSEEELMEEGY
jgi:cytochrome bd ubiquinol oxidase subunit II